MVVLWNERETLRLHYCYYFELLSHSGFNHAYIYIYIHAGEGAPVHEAYFGEGTGEIHIYMCKNNDNNLSDCTHMHTSTINWWASCHHLLDAGVICRGTYFKNSYTTSYTQSKQY